MYLTHPHKKKLSGVVSGEGRSHGIGPRRGTQRPGKCMSRYSQTIRAHLAGISHLVDDVAADVTDTGGAYPGRSALSLFFRK
jgi:hypothetical protein